MTIQLTHNAYGKHRVRVSKIKRDASHPERHTFIEATVDVELEGELDAAYTEADNRSVVATDTCKNTIYVLAKDDGFDTIESFGVKVAKHFLSQYSHLTKVTARLSETSWTRLLECPHAFQANQRETPTATVVSERRGDTIVSAGLSDMVLAKTSQSGFSDFHRDEFRTLPDTTERIMATSVLAEWQYTHENVSFGRSRQTVRKALMDNFINHYSNSVQETLMRMGEAAVKACEDVVSITLTMPNKHHVPFDLSPFKRENNHEVFVVTDEPYGYITATVGRSS